MPTEMCSRADRIDELFDCLRHARRRQLLEVLAAGPTPIPLDSVAEDIATAGPGDDRGSTVVDSTGEIAITLVHSHLPKLVEAGIVEVDDEANTVTGGDRFERALDLLVLV